MSLLNHIYQGDMDLMAAPEQAIVPQAEMALRKNQARCWPSLALTMVGEARLEHLHHCIQVILKEAIPGDFLEAGVWRGGASIYMRGVLKAYQECRRKVWVADSFRGLPLLQAHSHPLDKACGSLSYEHALEVSESFVQQAFESLGLWDEQVVLLPGWFNQSLLNPAMTQLSLLRIDCDYYVSTLDVLESLYPRLSPGAFVIVDDYGALPACRQAVLDFREKYAILDEMKRIDGTAIYWRCFQSKLGLR